MKNKKVLNTPDNITPELEQQELTFTKEEIAPFTGQQEDVSGHECVVGRDWSVGSKDDE